MEFRLLAPLRDFTREEAIEHLKDLWKGYDWETIVSMVLEGAARRAAAQRGSASEPAVVEVKKSANDIGFVRASASAAQATKLEHFD